MTVVLVVTAFTVLVSAAVFVVAFRRQRRLMGDELRGEWKGLPRERKRAVVRAVRRGEAVPDPRDAQLAAEYAGYLDRLQQRGRWRRRLIWVDVVFLAFGAVVAVVSFASGGGWHTLLRVYPLLLIVGGLVMRRRLRERAARARSENAKLHETVFTSRQ